MTKNHHACEDCGLALDVPAFKCATCEAIVAIRHLVSPGWKPHTKPARHQGLDVRDWVDEVRLLLARYDVLRAAEKPACRTPA